MLFRKNVLKQQHYDKKIYSFSKKDDSGRYRKHENEVLKKNVLTLVERAAEVDVGEIKHGSLPLFVGKRIQHTFSGGNVYKGYVISIVPGFPEWYNVKYENDPAIYAYNLREDYQNGDVQIIIENL